ncbi:MAG: phosphoribosylanthranilate isomerase [Bacteroidota bacterium]
MSRPKVKICCIGSTEEAELALRAGADALGLVSAMPSGPGVIAESKIAEIIVAVPPDTDTFLLTSATTAEVVIRQHIRCPASTIQLVDAVPVDAYAALRIALPEVRIVQVIHVVDATALHEAEAVAPHVDALLLDSGNPNLAVKSLGGTGHAHDWRISRSIVEAVDRPVWLAGGLRAHNVAEAIATVRPYGVDLCTGVRTEGRLDAEKLSAFMAAVASTG